MFWNRPKPPSDVENRLAAVETGLKLVRLEMEDTLEKVLAALARLRKRDRDAVKDEPIAPAQPPTAATGRAELWKRAAEILGRKQA